MKTYGAMGLWLHAPCVQINPFYTPEETALDRGNFSSFLILVTQALAS